MFDDEDKRLITEFGLESFEESLQVELLSQYYETRDLRVSMALEDQLSDEQLEEFENLYTAADDAATMAWLKTTVVDYDTIVATETAAVKADILATMKSLGDSVADKQQ